MFAIVDIAGQQFKVEEQQKLYVHQLKGDEGSKVHFENVLLLNDDKKINVGSPYVDGASVNATIINHLKDNKVIVFKKKRRKGYKVTRGHRQFLTVIQIDKIQTKKKAKAEKTKEPQESTELQES